MGSFHRTSIDSDSQLHSRVSYCAWTLLLCWFIGTGERTGPQIKISYHLPSVLYSSKSPYISVIVSKPVLRGNSTSLILPSSYQINHKVLVTLHSVNLWIWSLKIMSLSSWSCLLFLHSMNHSQHALVEYGNYSIYRSWIFLIAYRLTLILLTQQRKPIITWLLDTS